MSRLRNFLGGGFLAVTTLLTGCEDYDHHDHHDHHGHPNEGECYKEIMALVDDYNASIYDVLPGANSNEMVVAGEHFSIYRTETEPLTDADQLINHCAAVIGRKPSDVYSRCDVYAGDSPEVMRNKFESPTCWDQFAATSEGYFVTCGQVSLASEDQLQQVLNSYTVWQTVTCDDESQSSSHQKGQNSEDNVDEAVSSEIHNGGKFVSVPELELPASSH